MTKALRYERVSEIKTRHQVKLDREAILRLAGDIVKDIPENATVTIHVPGGGDWSHMDLDVCAQTPVIITWYITTYEEGDTP